MSRDPYAIIADRAVSGAVVVDRRALKGGVSAEVERLTLRRPDGATEAVVVRRHGAASFKDLADDVTVVEYRLLEALAQTDVPVPDMRFVDDTCRVLPTPYFVMSFVDGQTVPEPSPRQLRRMAEQLASIHRLGADDVPTLPIRVDPVADARRDLPDAPLAAPLRAHAEQPPPTQVALLHGDYWSGNLLWEGDDIVAVLDWEDAALGDAMSDVAGARMEVLWRGGASAMEAFTEHYAACRPIDSARLALWEIYVGAAALGSMAQWGLPDTLLATMEQRTAWFVSSAAGT